MLFGHLASRFSTQPENLATEALAFILDRSPAMPEALRRLVGRSGIELPPLTTFRSQVGDEHGNIPDLVGVDANRAERLLIENKFWAGLTENQPAGYLQRLPAEGGAVLLFVVPSKRLPIVWSELARSAVNRGRDLPDPEQLPGDLLFARLSSSRALAVTTWSAILDSLEAAARAADETSAAADIAQLRSLCDMMDNEAFLPVRTEELSNLEVPRRLIGLADLIPVLSEKAEKSGIADRTGLKETPGRYPSGRYLWICPSETSRAQIWLGVDHEKWARYGTTPLWIRFDNVPQSGRAPFVLQALKAWTRTRLFRENGRALIPLTVLPDATREKVLDDLLEQLRRLHAALGAGDPPLEIS
jgi:hypothetical protein